MKGRVLTLVRHGEIVGAETRRYIGRSDIPLSPRGIARALSLRETLKRTHFDVVYCSSLARSRQTAEIIAGGNGADIRVRDGLLEISLGVWEGRSRDEIATRFPDQFAARGEDIAGYRIAGGESFADCRTRVLAAFSDIVDLHGGNVLIAGHGGVNRLLLCHVLGMPTQHLFRIDQDYGCMNVLREHDGAFRVSLMNFVPDRAAAAEPVPAMA